MSKEADVNWVELADQKLTYGEARDLSNTLWDAAEASTDHKWALVAAHEAGKMDMLSVIIRAENQDRDMHWSLNWEFKAARDFITDTLTEEE